MNALQGRKQETYHKIDLNGRIEMRPYEKKEDGDPSFEVEKEEEAPSAEAFGNVLTFSAASETPYERWFGYEILGLNPGEVDLTRLNNGAPLLADHDPRCQIGVIERAWVESGRLMVEARFSANEEPQEYLRDMIDGIRRNISVGYTVDDMHLISSIDGTDSYRITKWQPLEVSVVSIPADTSVGLGRADEDPGLRRDDGEPSPGPLGHPSEEEKTNPVGVALCGHPSEVSDLPEPEPGQKEAAPTMEVKDLTAERQRVADILALGREFKMPEDTTQAAVTNGTTADAFREAIIGHIRASQCKVENVGIGMTPAETQRYSLSRAIQAAASNDWSRAGFEKEASQAAEKQYGRSAKGSGFIVPHEVLTRTQVAGTANVGGNLIQTQLDGRNFIEYLYNAIVLPGLGAQRFDGLTGNLSLPRQTGGEAASWVSEGSQVSATDITFDQVTFTPKTVMGRTEVTKQLLAQAILVPGVDSFIWTEIATAISVAIQQAAINGATGGNNPVGILQTSGIGSVALGTNGAAPTYDALVNLETLVAQNNAILNGGAYLANAKTRGVLKRTPVFNGFGGAVWQNDEVNGYTAAMTNAMPSNLTKGSGSNLSAILFGDFSQCGFGMWGGLDITVDPYSKADYGILRIIGLQLVDFEVLRPASFGAIVDAVTT